MTDQRTVQLLKPVLFFLLIFISCTGCNKEENQSEPEEHYGWHESMEGKILFNDGSQLFFINAVEATEITLNEDIKPISDAKWSPDGSKIVFVSNNQGIMIVNSDGSGDTTIVENEECRSPVWSPDGTMIAYILYDSICILNLKNNNLTIFEQLLSVHDNLCWAPTGNKIAFTDNTYDSLRYIKILNLLDGSTTELLQSTSRRFYYPSWSPDETKIAFQSVDDGGIPLIFIVNDDGTNMEQLHPFPTSKYSFSSPSWSSEGTMIALATYNGVFVMDLKGAIITKIKISSDIIDYVDWH